MKAFANPATIRVWARKRRLTQQGIVAITCALLLVCLPAWGQSPSPKPTLPNPILQLGSSNTTNSATDFSTEDVRLDGRRLFTIAAPAASNKENQAADTPPIRDRVNKIEETLNNIANRQFTSKTLQVTSSIDQESRLPVIYVGIGDSPEAQQYLMTVTTLDAQLQGQIPEQRADELTQTIKQALLTARAERQPESLTKQGLLAAEILFGMVITSWLVGLRQRYLRARREQDRAQPPAEIESSPDTLNPTSTTALRAMQERMNRRQQRNLNEVRLRLLQLLQVFIWGGGSFVVLGLFPYTRWLQALTLSGPITILGIGIATYVAIRISDVLIDRFFSVLTTEELITPDTSQRLALRISTFSRVLRSIVGIVLITIAILSILSLLGVRLGPLLAGAGILGLAISFASQNLIKDMINGLLILSEDQYAVGDVVQIGKVSGLVEYMNLRITQLRNAEGRLITIPNSTITVVENLSKDWSRVDLAITIAYDADADKAIEVIKHVGEQMSRDPAWRNRIAEPPEVLGIDEINNAGVTLRIWIKTKPLEQWNVAREFRRRLKQALDEEGIAIGLPQQSFWFRGSTDTADKVLTEEENKVKNGELGR